MFMAKSTTAIVDKLYPLVEKSMDTNYSKYKKCLSNFMEKRSKDLFATAPINRIFYGAEDAEELYQALNISKSTIHSIIEQTYYWQIAAFKPSAAKDELTILAMMIIRYFYLTTKISFLNKKAIFLSSGNDFIN